MNSFYSGMSFELPCCGDTSRSSDAYPIINVTSLGIFAIRLKTYEVMALLVYGRARYSKFLLQLVSNLTSPCSPSEDVNLDSSSCLRLGSDGISLLNELTLMFGMLHRIASCWKFDDLITSGVLPSLVPVINY